MAPSGSALGVLELDSVLVVLALLALATLQQDVQPPAMQGSYSITAQLTVTVSWWSAHKLSASLVCSAGERP